MGLIDDAITAHYGERCDDVQAGCQCCNAWAEYDDLLRHSPAPSSRFAYDPYIVEAPLIFAGEALTIAKGQFYIRRDGVRVGPVVPTGLEGRPWGIGNICYTDTGRIYASGVEHPLDLMETA